MPELPPGLWNQAWLQSFCKPSQGWGRRLGREVGSFRSSCSAASCCGFPLPPTLRTPARTPDQQVTRPEQVPTEARSAQPFQVLTTSVLSLSSSKRANAPHLMGVPPSSLDAHLSSLSQRVAKQATMKTDRPLPPQWTSLGGLGATTMIRTTALVVTLY